MAVPVSLVEAYRRDLAALLNIAQGDLAVLFRGASDGVELREALMDVLPQLVAIYGEAAAALAADWYDEVRDSSDASGRFRAIPAELPDRGRTDSLASWGVAPVFGGSGVNAAQALVAGGFQRIIADAGRDTVITSLKEDPQGRGWRRHTRGGCDFCKLVASKGAVYSPETASFSSHDNCGCVAVPSIGEAVEVKPYVPSQRFRSDKQRAANNKRVRKAIAARAARNT